MSHRCDIRPCTEPANHQHPPGCHGYQLHHPQPWVWPRTDDDGGGGGGDDGGNDGDEVWPGV